jgi:hypothetical protein
MSRVPHSAIYLDVPPSHMLGHMLDNRNCRQLADQSDTPIPHSSCNAIVVLQKQRARLVIVDLYSVARSSTLLTASSVTVHNLEQRRGDASNAP